jgi:hypothetical protein
MVDKVGGQNIANLSVSKLIFLLPLVFLAGFARIAEGQQNIQFIYIGSDPRGTKEVLLTSGAFQGDYLVGEDSHRAKIYYVDQRTLDTIRSYILQSNLVKRSDTSKSQIDKVDTVKFLDAYKIIATEPDTLYVKGKDCEGLFVSTWQHLAGLGLINTPGFNAMQYLMFQCYVEAWHRDLILGPPPYQILAPSITDTPRITAKPNN